MKKIIKKVLISALIMFSLISVGCKKEDDKESEVREAKFEEITYEELNYKMKENENLILLIKSNDCAECVTYEETINEYVQTKKETIYYLNVTAINIDSELESLILNAPSYESEVLILPSTVIVKKGTITNAISGDLKYSELEEFINSYINLTLQQLEDKIESNKNFIFLIKSRYCSHCIEYEPTIKEYIKNTGNVIYYIDVANSSDSSMTTTRLMAIKGKIELVNSDYDKLYTPVTVKVNNGSITDALIGQVGYETLKNFI